MKSSVFIFLGIRLAFYFTGCFPIPMCAASLDELNWFSDTSEETTTQTPLPSVVQKSPVIYDLENVAPSFDIAFDTVQDLQQNILEKSVSISQIVNKNSPQEKELIAQVSPEPSAAPSAEEAQNNLEQEKIARITPEQQKTILINFNNVSMIEYIRFISRLTNKNFLFDEGDLQFNVTIISEEPTSLQNTMTALLQELRIHDLMLIEEGNNFIIHKNPKVNSISKVVAGDITSTTIKDSEIITKVFRLNTMDPEKAAAIIRPLVSEISIIEVLKETNHIIVTDLAANIIKISELLKSLDAPRSGLVIGQYVARLFPIDSLIPMAERIMQPIAQDQPLSFVPQQSTNSIFIISTPYLVERTISIIQYIDQEQAQTQIIEPQKLGFEKGAPPPPPTPPTQFQEPTGQWILGPDGKWIFNPHVAPGTATPPQGEWRLDDKGNWYFVPGGSPSGNRPKGQWELDSNGNWLFGLEKNEAINPSRLTRGLTGPAGLPGGVKKVIKFYTHKLLYRKGEEIQNALHRIADSLRYDEKKYEALLTALSSIQWIEPSNSLIITGIPEALKQVRELIEEIDIPLREVFLEMLILNTTIDDALNYGVTYGTRFGGGDLSGAQGFIEGLTPIANALTSTGLNTLGLPIGSNLAAAIIPDGTKLANANGFNLGVIGRKITHCGTEFGSIGALVSSLHDRNKTNIIMNPKIITEDNAPAEIFIGINTAFKTQSISNDLGSVITNNFEFRDVGTRLKVTPYISNDDMVTMDIVEEVSAVISGLQTTVLSNTQNVGPTTSLNTMTTRVHIPNGYFLVIGGLMQDQYVRNRSQVPCLGGVPILGGLFTTKSNSDNKTNTMIFVRPIIVDSEEEIEHLTKHQQDIWRYKRNLKDSWDYETEEALDWFNVRRTLYNEHECDYENIE